MGLAPLLTWVAQGCMIHNGRRSGWGTWGPRGHRGPQMVKGVNDEEGNMVQGSGHSPSKKKSLEPMALRIAPEFTWSLVRGPVVFPRTITQSN